METQNSLPIRAVLWDMDGTLIDSGEYHWRSWDETMQKEGIRFTYEQFRATFGQRNDTILRDLISPDITLEEIARIADAKEHAYRLIVQREGISLLPGVQEWLMRLNQAGWRQAVASSAPRANIETILRVLQISWCFDAIAASEDVERGKPDPQVFQMAADRLGVPHNRCIVVEDAPAGVEGARRAGMRAIGVRSSHGELDAEVVVDRLDQLPEDIFNQLLEA